MTPRSRFLVAAIALAFAINARVDAQVLSLRLDDEAAPANSIVQVKLDVTEPKPISTGKGKVKTPAFRTVNGIFLMNAGQDTYGVAMVDGDGLSFNVVSPSSLFGTQADYPILGIAGTVKDAPAGATFPLRLEGAALGFHDPSGAVYPTELKDGVLTVTPGAVVIGDVKPGSRVVAAGDVVHIYGTNFTPTTRLQLSEVAIAEQRFVSNRQIDVVLAQTARMHGLRIRVRNDDKGGTRSESEYFSYERTTPLGTSSDDVFRNVVPLFAPAEYNEAVVDLPRPPARRRRAAGPSGGSGSGAPANLRVGVALQNIESNTATVSIELLDSAGAPYAVNTLSIGPDRHLVRELGEIFGNTARPSAFRIRSDVPIHVLGLATDSSGGAFALPPH